MQRSHPLGQHRADYAVAYTSAPGDFTVTKAPLVITASNGSMTYGGTVPTITPAYSGLRQRRDRIVADHTAHLLDHGHKLEPGVGQPYVSSCGGAVDPNYAFSYVGGISDREPGSLDDHRLERRP